MKLKRGLIPFSREEVKTGDRIVSRVRGKETYERVIPSNYKLGNKCYMFFGRGYVKITFHKGDDNLWAVEAEIQRSVIRHTDRLGRMELYIDRRTRYQRLYDTIFTL